MTDAAGRADYLHPARLPANAEGPFYTTGVQFDDGTWRGDCMRCGTPELAAPTLLNPATDADYDTYFVRQPRTEQEVAQACDAIDACCVNALRYGGHDPRILARLDAVHCDFPPDGFLRRLFRFLFARRHAR